MNLEKVQQVLVSYKDYLETKQLLLQRLSDITSNIQIMLINNEEESIDEAFNSRQIIMDKIDELEQQHGEIISFFQGASGKSILSKCESFNLDILKFETSNVDLLKVIFSKNILIDKKVQERYKEVSKKLKELKQSKKVNSAYDSQYSSAPDGIYFDKKK